MAIFSYQPDTPPPMNDTVKRYVDTEFRKIQLVLQLAAKIIEQHEQRISTLEGP